MTPWPPPRRRPSARPLPAARDARSPAELYGPLDGRQRRVEDVVSVHTDDTCARQLRHLGEQAGLVNLLDPFYEADRWDAEIDRDNLAALGELATRYGVLEEEPDLDQLIWAGEAL